MDKQIMEQLTKALKSWVCDAEHQALREQRVYDGYCVSQEAMAFQTGVLLGINLMADAMIARADQLLGGGQML